MAWIWNCETITVPVAIEECALSAPEVRYAALQQIAFSPPTVLQIMDREKDFGLSMVGPRIRALSTSFEFRISLACTPNGFRAS